MSDCAKCTTRLKPNALFCTKCGHKVVAASAPADKKPPPAAAAPPDKDECVSCGTALKKAALFCTKCGHKVAPAKASPSEPPKSPKSPKMASGQPVPAPSVKVRMLDGFFLLLAPPAHLCTQARAGGFQTPTTAESPTAERSPRIGAVRASDSTLLSASSPTVSALKPRVVTATRYTNAQGGDDDADPEAPSTAPLSRKGVDSPKLVSVVFALLLFGSFAQNATTAAARTTSPSGGRDTPGQMRKEPPKAESPRKADSKPESPRKADPKPESPRKDDKAAAGTTKTAAATPTARKVDAPRSESPAKGPGTRKDIQSPPPLEEKPERKGRKAEEPKATEATDAPKRACTNCSAPLRPTALFCTKCGTKQARTDQPPSGSRKSLTIDQLPQAEVPRDLSPRFAGPVGSSRGPRAPSIAVQVSPREARASLSRESGSRESRKGSWRESIMIPKDAFRESMVISPEEREAAMAKIDSMLGMSSSTKDVKITCVLDSVRKELVVEALDGIINGRSIQIAWNLLPEQELHIQFVGLRAPNGEEIPFEVSEEVPWPHIPLWEEVIFENEAYEILYEDDRDIDVDRLSPEQVVKMEADFDAMGTCVRACVRVCFFVFWVCADSCAGPDVKKEGFLTRQGLTEYFTERCLQRQRDREGRLDKILSSGVLSKSRKVKISSAMKVCPPSVLAVPHSRCVQLDENSLAEVQEAVDRIMGMDITGNGRVELHEYARACAASLAIERSSLSRQSERGKRMSTIQHKGGSSSGGSASARAGRK